MIPISILKYLKIGAAVAALCFSWYLGYSFEAARFERYKAEQITEAMKKEHEAQAATDEIRKAKDAQIRVINNQLVDAISELRKRSSRSQGTNNGQNCNGASLYAEDAEFLVREAARADEMRLSLAACYKQYDAIK